MSDAPKPIKNSLLSAATGSNFFEDAALFVPVPLVEPEPQEPATAEIDLNSDDSPPNRASVEKEFAEQLTLNETVQEVLPPQPVAEEQPAAISLFSRAATSGGDLFSRMLAGSSVPKPESTNTTIHPQEVKQSFVPPPNSSFTPVKEPEEEEEEAPSVVNLFSAPPERLNALTPNTSHTDFLSNARPLPSYQQSVKPTDNTEVASTASLFSSGSAFVPTNVTRRGSPSFQTVLATPLNSTVVAPSFQTVLATASNSAAAPPSFQTVLATSSSNPAPGFPNIRPETSNSPITGPSFQTVYGQNANSTTGAPSFQTILATQQPNFTTAAPSFQTVLAAPSKPSEAVAPAGPFYPGSDNGFYPLPTAKPSLTSIPTVTPSPMVPLIPSATQIQQNVPEALPSQGAPPSGNSNAFRLGGQRMKYVPCPEMQAAPVAGPPQTLPFNPIIATSPASTFIPAAPMGANMSSASPLYSRGATTSVPGGVASASPMAQNGPSAAQSPPTSSRPPMGTNVFHNPPSSHVGQMQAYGPQELPALTYHWFYRKDVDGKTVWKPFSIIDSVALEDAYSHEPERLVPTDGGRYDVCVQKRLKMPVYWEEAPIEVRRGSWFFKGPMDNRFIPYDEEFAVKLESEYADCMRTGVWQKRLEFPDGESVIMHSAGVVVHFCQAAAPDDWGNLPESQIRPRVVKRGVDEIEVEDGESPQIDHLVFVVHGIGPICDFKLRNIVEAVDDFRGLSFQLLHSHFRESIEKTMVGRVEFLPVSWHKALHGDKGIDEQLKRITLRSIPKFRDFTNDTLLDILFYTSPVYCQTIVNSVSSELNRIYKLFLSRNPSFHGNVSLTGHSLGSLILFDLLAHQPVKDAAVSNLDSDKVDDNAVDLVSQQEKTEDVATVGLASSSRTVSYTVGTAGTGQPFITYPKIDFAPCAFFALGSPIAMFVTVRGIEKLGNDFRLPTCPAFFNIFHPYDPVAYRIETLIDPDFQNRPVLIPHHKGRKRIHLELKETMARVGADIKHKVIDAVKNTLNTVYHYTGFSKTGENLDNEIQSAIAGEMEKKSEADGAEDENAHIRIGSLNGGRRIDYVLQEAPYETFNEYVFAMSTHVGYWESEDTMLLILTEVYGSMGIQRDRQVTGAQGVTSPTNPAVGGSNSNANVYPTPVPSQYDAFSYQPSAPPLHIPAQVQTSQSMFNVSPTVIPQSAVPAIPQQPVPMIQSPTAAGGVLLPPNPVQGTVASPPSVSGRPSLIGNRPVTDPSYYPRGMDPTAPMLTMSQVAPPPKMGFVPKQN